MEHLRAETLQGTVLKYGILPHAAQQVADWLRNLSEEKRQKLAEEARKREAAKNAGTLGK